MKPPHCLQCARDGDCAHVATVLAIQIQQRHVHASLQHGLVQGLALDGPRSTEKAVAVGVRELCTSTTLLLAVHAVACVGAWVGRTWGCSGEFQLRLDSRRFGFHFRITSRPHDPGIPELMRDLMYRLPRSHGRWFKRRALEIQRQSESAQLSGNEPAYI